MRRNPGWYRESMRHSIAARQGWKNKRGYKKRNIPSWMKHITHKQFIHWDFDRDGVANIDDRKPFDPNQSNPVDRDSRYSREIKEIEKFRRKHLPHTQEIERKLRGAFPENQGYFVAVRRKSAPSILNKMRREMLAGEKKPEPIGDTTGALVVSEDKKIYNKAKRKIRKTGINIVAVEDIYKTKRIPHYKATHYDIRLDKDLKGEVQLKTERQRRLHKILHSHYKKGKTYGPYTRNQAIKEAYKRDLLDRQSRLKIRKKDFWAKI